MLTRRRTLAIAGGVFGIGIGLSLVFLFANFLNVPEFTPQLASMIGIGVGIDYALFIVTRFRQFLHQGWDPERAVVGAITTSALLSTRCFTYSAMFQSLASGRWGPCSLA